MNDAFVYLWYDAPNKKYYLGKHKGSPNDIYTHSSSMWESFTKDNIPKGVTRRILAYGTHEEMCILEHKLLVNRKNRCWNRYYNTSLGDPRYVDQSGENNPMYKDGSSVGKHHDPEIRRKWDRTYQPVYYQNNIVKIRKQSIVRSQRYRDKKNTERQGAGTLEGYLG
jgi:hypothetical protein